MDKTSNRKNTDIKTAYLRLISIFFPNRCPYCNKLIEPLSHSCEYCKKDIPVHGYFRGVNGGFRCCSPLIYQGKYKRAVRAFKFKKKTHYSPHFAQLMYEQIQKTYEDYVFDCITYVPMYYKDERERGYNQSQLLAQDLSKLMKIPCVETLKKIKQTDKQHDLKSKERRQNLKGAFKPLDKSYIKGKHILLIDDIVTTSTTLRECSKTLEKAKPAQVCCATLLSTVQSYKH